MTVRSSRSGLLVIELVIAIGVFALCAAFCVGLFVQADSVSRDSAALGQAAVSYTHLTLPTILLV